MKLQLIRSATLRINYAHSKFVIDPYLAAKHSRPSITGRSPNPMVELPCAPEEVIAGIGMVLVSHLHSDHFDPAAQKLLPKDTPILCQPGDQSRIAAMGFRQVIPVRDHLDWNGMTLTRTDCQHGSGEVLAEMGRASGFILQAENEPTVYWTGDTVLTENVKETIAQFRPEIIITHSCGAVWGKHVLIVMDAEQTMTVCQLAPESIVVATHMEALDHATITRDDLRRSVVQHGIRPEQLLIPADGETLVF